MTEKVMVLWSGGVESTSLLKHLLTDTDVEVVAHHVRMINPEGRLAKETNAIHLLAPKLQAIRPFKVVFSTVSICGGQALSMDYEVQYPIGILAMRHEGCTKLYRAGCLEDDWDHQMQLDGTLITERPSSAPGFSHERRAQTLRPLLRDQEPNDVAPYLDWYKHTKAWHIAYLGELFDLTWSCRKPVGDETCGVCHSCQERAAGVLGRSAIDEINAQEKTA